MQERSPISVILPVHNGEATIGEAAASVLTQTHRDIQLIVIDDASTDGTLDVLAAIPDERLEVVSIARSGPSASRNRGIELATSEFVAFIDADDVWLPGKLSAQLSALDGAPDAAVAYCWTDYIDPAGRYLSPDSRPRFEGNVRACLLGHNFIDSGSNILARRKHLLEVGGFDESLPVVEDWDLYLKLAAQHPFVCVPEALVQYRQSSTSLTNRVTLMEEFFWRVIDRAFAGAPASLQHLKPRSAARFYQYLIGKATYDCPSRSDGLTALRFLAQAIRHRPASLLLMWRHGWVVKALLKAILSIVLPEPAMRWGVRHWPHSRRAAARPPGSGRRLGNGRVILFICRQVPHPLDGGLRIRQRNLLQAYANVGDVRLLFAYEDEAELEELHGLEELCSNIHPVRFDWRNKARAPGLNHWRRELRTAGPLRSFRRHLFFSREMQSAAERLGETSDLVHVDNLHLVPYVQGLLDRKVRRQRLILDLDDVETRVRRRWLRFSPPETWKAYLAHAVDLALVAREQRSALRAFDRVLACSEHDRHVLGGGPKISVVPNGTDVPSQPLPDDSDGRTILCLGTYGYEPNVHGLRGFLRQVLPRIRREIPDVRVLVVGRDMPESVIALEDGHTIRVHPDVESVEPFYRQATVSAVPLKIAGGTRLRILESFALGRPVVSTTVGCEGIDARDGEALLIADRPQAFARACVSLLRDRELRARLIGRARTLAVEDYAWESIRQRLSGVAAELLRESPSAIDTTPSNEPELPENIL